jgi:hypothetical protein
MGAKHTGTATLGVDGVYQGVWQFSVNYNKYLGGSEPFLDYRPLLTGGHATYTRAIRWPTATTLR